MTGAALRIDKLLWYLRLAPSRRAAQDMALAGHIRANGVRVTKAAQPVRCGDILTLPIAAGVRVIEVAVLPHRRGPAPEARACYRDRTAAIESDSQRGEVIDAGAPAALGG